jgi:hypothetical protein
LQHIIEELEKQYAVEDFAKIKLPLLEVVSYGQLTNIPL